MVRSSITHAFRHVQGILYIYILDLDIEKNRKAAENQGFTKLNNTSDQEQNSKA